MTPETKYAKSGDVHIAYQVLGERPVDLVFIPGWVTHVELSWENRWRRTSDGGSGRSRA